MKPRNREVNIFNMSVLDLLTGALGAFCFLTLALFPYYFKAQNASAAGSSAGAANAGLKAKNESLKAQIAAEKAAGNQMPPFALLSLNSINAQNSASCATLVLKSATQPPGAPPVGYRLTSAQPDGSAYGIYLFAIRTGPYRFVASVTLIASGPCTISISTVNAIQRSQQLVITQAQDVQFDFNVEGGDFAASLFD
jgi:hypothetical protein